MMSKVFSLFTRRFNRASASPLRTSVKLLSMPSVLRFSEMEWSVLGFFSTKVTLAAPRLKASMPMAPVPAKRSKKEASWMKGVMISKTALRTRPVVGRVVFPLRDFKRRPLYFPARMRTVFLLAPYPSQLDSGGLFLIGLSPFQVVFLARLQVFTPLI